MQNKKPKKQTSSLLKLWIFNLRNAGCKVTKNPMVMTKWLWKQMSSTDLCNGGQLPKDKSGARRFLSCDPYCSTVPNQVINLTAFNTLKNLQNSRYIQKNCHFERTLAQSYVLHRFWSSSIFSPAKASLVTNEEKKRQANFLPAVNLTWLTDYPYPRCFFPNVLLVLRGNFNSLPTDDELSSILLWLTAQDFTRQGDL